MAVLVSRRYQTNPALDHHSFDTNVYRNNYNPSSMFLGCGQKSTQTWQELENPTQAVNEGREFNPGLSGNASI